MKYHTDPLLNKGDSSGKYRVKESCQDLRNVLYFLVLLNQNYSNNDRSNCSTEQNHPESVNDRSSIGRRLAGRSAVGRQISSVGSWC